MNKQSKTFWICCLSALFTLFVILVGSYTRLTDAGLGCPDWPGCYGQISVPQTLDNIAKAEQLYPTSPVEHTKAWTEMFHRYLAGTLGLFVFGIAFSCLTAHKRQVSRILPYALMCIIVFQAALGMWTVTLRLLPVIVMGHLLGGFTLLSLLFLTAMQLRKRPLYASQHRLRLSALYGVFLLVAIIGQIFLGGWTSSNYAALVCPDFPTCLGTLWPTFDSGAFNLLTGVGYDTPTLAMSNTQRVVIQASHRLGALIVFLGTLAFSGYLMKKRHLKTALCLTVLVTLQVLLGISNVVMLLPVSIAVAHTGTAAVLLLTTLYATYKLSYQGAPQ